MTWGTPEKIEREKGAQTSKRQKYRNSRNITSDHSIASMPKFVTRQVTRTVAFILH